MPNWSELIEEIQKTPSPIDHVRKKYIKRLSELRGGRNVITYYSSFLSKPGFDTGIRDEDKSMFMTAIHHLDKNKGLDLIINTEGGNIAATESIVDYLYKIFGNEIDIFVPQIAMSAGTLMACAGKNIYLGLQSNLGPIDPQMNGISAKLVTKEFEEAWNDLSNNIKVTYWQIQLTKYPVTFYDLCKNAITWSEHLAKKWLIGNMLKDESAKDIIADNIIRELSDPGTTYSHGRHIHIDKLESLGLKIIRLEENEELQDAVLSIHHTYMHSFQNTSAIKICENQLGIATVFHQKPQ